MPPEPAHPPDPASGVRLGRGVGRVIHIHLHIYPLAPPKPVVGAPCNGCGVCCLAEPCPLGMLVSGRRSGACAALRWQGEQARYVCGVVAPGAPALSARWRWLAPWVQRLARRWIAVGVGCDADLEVEVGVEVAQARQGPRAP